VAASLQMACEWWRVACLSLPLVQNVTCWLLVHEKGLGLVFTGKFERFCAGSGTAGSRIGIKNADECICVS
jgi:hypothetical protein